MNESDMVRNFSVGYDTRSDFRMSDLPMYYSGCVYSTFESMHEEKDHNCRN